MLLYNYACNSTTGTILLSIHPSNFFLFFLMIPLPPISTLFPYTTFFFFFFNDTATTEIYTLSLHDALPIFQLSAEIFQLLRAESTFQKRPSVHPGRGVPLKINRVAFEFLAARAEEMVEPHFIKRRR